VKLLYGVNVVSVTVTDLARAAPARRAL